MAYIRKTTLILMIFLISNVAFSSDNLTVNLKPWEKNDTFIHTSIDGKYPITIHLNYEYVSVTSRGRDYRYYYVEGWYYYDKYQTKIALQGVFDYVAADPYWLSEHDGWRLRLYTGLNPKARTVIRKNLHTNDFEVGTDFFDNAGFDEKFTIDALYDMESEEYKFTTSHWIKGSKALPIDHFPTPELPISDYLLDIQENKVDKQLRLSQLGIEIQENNDNFYTNIELLSYAREGTGLSLLFLRRTEGPMCYAHDVNSLIALTLDGSGKVTSHEEYEVYRCDRITSNMARLIDAEYALLNQSIPNMSTDSIAVYRTEYSQGSSESLQTKIGSFRIVDAKVMIEVPWE